MTKKLIAITLLILTIIPCLRAQRKEISQARSYIKSGKELAKAETMLRDAIRKDSSSRQDPRVYASLLQAIEKQYAEGNEKLYLKQKYDTTQLFTLTKKLFDVALQLDSLDALPDEKGRVKTKYREKNIVMLDRCRPNLFFGGTFHLRKGDNERAFTLFDTYISCSTHPMFAAYDYSKNDKRMPEAAYWATVCGHNADNVEMTLRHAEMAENDTARLSYTLMYEAIAYEKTNDTEKYFETLKRGFNLFPTFSYFFPHLIDFYTKNGEMEEALATADKALETDSTNILFLYAKSNALLNLGRNDDCIKVGDRIIELNDSVAEAYYNVGMAFLNNVVIAEKGSQTTKRKEEIKKLYIQARPYLERYREMAPEARQKWAPALYRVYLNLNLGNQFEEIDKIINEL